MLLGLDLGTTNVKAVLTRRNGGVVARASAPVRLYHTPDGGTEQDIDEIWAATRSAIGECVAAAEASEPVEAVGVSSQGGALQVLDQHGRPQGRVISWLDTRGRPYDEALNDELGREWFIAHVGHAGSRLAIGQIERLRHERALPAEARIAFVGDMIVGRLCEHAAHDATSLSLGMLYNPSQHRADPDLLARLQLDEAHLPALFSPRAAAGRLTGSVARDTGLPAGIPVSPAVHDQYAAALGANVTHAGDVMVGTGTAWVLLLVSPTLEPPIANRSFVCTHLVEKLYGQILSMYTGGSALSWSLELTGQDNCSGDALDALFESVPAGCDGMRVQPHFVTPVRANLANAGYISGVRLQHGKAHLVRAVLEGLACELARYLDFARAANVPVHGLVLCGAAARSRVTPQIIADVTDLPVTCLVEHDTSAFGAAILARGLLELDAPLQAIAADMQAGTRTVAPGPQHDLYTALLEEYLDAT